MSEQTAVWQTEYEVKQLMARCMALVPGMRLHVSCLYTASGKHAWSISAVTDHQRFEPNASSYEGWEDAERQFKDAVTNWRHRSTERAAELRQEADELERQAKGPACE